MITEIICIVIGVIFVGAVIVAISEEIEHQREISKRTTDWRKFD